MNSKQVKLIQSALRMAARQGFDPRNSHPSQALAFEKLARLNAERVS